MTDDKKGPERAKPHRRGAKKGNKGNKPLEVTEELRAKVKNLARAFPPLSQANMAVQLGITRNTLSNYFRQDIELARLEVAAQAGAQIVHLALHGKDARTADGKLIAPGEVKVLKHICIRWGGWKENLPQHGPE